LLLPICIAIASFIADNAGLISAVTVVGAITTFTTADAPRPELMNDPEAAQADFENALFVSTVWLTTGQSVLELGQALPQVRVNTGKEASQEPAQLRTGRLTHEKLGRQYVESLPPEQQPYVDIDRTFVDPLTGKRFRPDVVNHWTGEIIEYKPSSWQGNAYLTRRAEEQAKSYEGILNRMYQDQRILEGLPRYWWRVEYYKLK
jgi:hypothetical protein